MFIFFGVAIVSRLAIEIFNVKIAIANRLVIAIST